MLSNSTSGTCLSMERLIHTMAEDEISPRGFGSVAEPTTFWLLMTWTVVMFIVDEVEEGKEEDEGEESHHPRTTHTSLTPSYMQEEHK